MSTPALTVYFDGLCRVCSAEIEHYRRRDREERVRWVDIADPHFSAEAEGVDATRVHRVMHAKDAEGRFHTEVDAFIAIWKVIPGFHWLAGLAGLGVVRPALDLGYQAFVKVRPYLPRKKSATCNNDRCAT